MIFQSNHLGCKKVQGQEEAAYVGKVTYDKSLISLKAKKFGIYIVHTVSVTSFIFMHRNFTTTIGFVTWPPFVSYTLYTTKGGQVTKPIVVVKIRCINMNEVTDTVVNYAYPKLLGL